MFREVLMGSSWKSSRNPTLRTPANPSGKLTGAGRLSDAHETGFLSSSYLGEVFFELGFLIYIAMRMSFIGITHDEAVTYDFHVTDTILNIILYRSGMVPDNNHVLFTLLAKLSVNIFGLSVFALRLPSLIGAILFFVGSVRVFGIIRILWIRLLAVGVVVTNPFLVDFLALARGYGLGLGFTMLGVGLLLDSADGLRIRRVGYATGALLCFGLAALSQFTFVLVLAAALVFSFVASVTAEPRLLGTKIEQVTRKFISFLAVTWPAYPVLLYLIIPYRAFGTSNLVRVGGHLGFWQDTVTSLVEGTLYGAPDIEHRTESLALEIWIGVVCTLAVMLAFWRWPQLKGNLASFVVVFFLIFVVSFSSLFQVYFLNVSYLTERRGIFFIPLFLCATILMLNSATRIAPRWFVVFLTAIEIPVLAFLLYHNVLTLNVYWTLNWRFDASTPDLMALVQRTIDKRWPNQQVYMRAQFPLVPAINYYRMTMPVRSLPPVSRDDGLDGPAELYVALETSPEYAIARKHADEIIARYPSTGVVLLAHGIDNP